MINTWLEDLSTLIQNSFWLAPLIALLAGLLTSVTPCALSSVPLVIGYVGGTGSRDTKRAFKLSLVFSLGMAVTFTALGTIASLLGKLMGTSSPWWYIVLGILMVLMALQTFEIYNFIPSTYLIEKNTKRGYIGAFVAGILGGIFSSPCATPVLVVLLGIVARSGNVAWGILLLLLYSIGHSVLVLIAGTSIGFVQKVTTNNRYGAFSKVLKYGMGIAILLIAFYMFYLGFKKKEGMVMKQNRAETIEKNIPQGFYHAGEKQSKDYPMNFYSSNVDGTVSAVQGEFPQNFYSPKTNIKSESEGI